MKKCGLIFTILLSFMLTGCWDKVEIEDRDYVITMGMDPYNGQEDAKSKDDNFNKRFVFSLGIAGLTKSSGNQEQVGETSKGAKILTGTTPVSVMKTADLYSDKQAYYGQLKTVIFGEELLKNKKLFKEALDNLERNQEVNMRVIVLAASGTAKDVIGAVLNEDSPSGLYVWDFYKNNSKNVASTNKMDLEGLLTELRQEGKTIIPVVSVQDDRVKFGGGAVIDDYTLKGYLSDTEERGALWLSGHAKGAVVDGTFENNNISLTIIGNKCKIEFEESQGGIICRAKVTADGSVQGYTLEKQALLDSDNIKNMEEVFEKIIREEILNTIKINQSVYKTDALNIMQQMKKKNNDIYKRHNEDINKEFENMEFIIEPYVNIRGIGVVK